MRAIKQYFPVVLFIILCKAGLTFKFVDEIPKLLSNTFLSRVMFVVLYQVALSIESV